MRPIFSQLLTDRGRDRYDGFCYFSNASSCEASRRHDPDEGTNDLPANDAPNLKLEEGAHERSPDGARFGHSIFRLTHGGKAFEGAGGNVVVAKGEK